MTVNLAYLVSPEPGKYCLMIQEENGDQALSFEIAESHLGNIVADGAHHLLRKSILNPNSQARSEA